VARRFDLVVAVDWSASSRPVTGRDSIWIAARDRDGARIANPPTRHAAEGHLRTLLDAAPDASVLVAVDFSLGYPAGTATSLGLRGVPWRATWTLLAELVLDDVANRNNRFAVAAELNRRITDGPAPFWGVPPAAASATLGPTKPPGRSPLAEWRIAEQRLRAHGLRPFSCWQLLGAGAVGGQSLVGIPVLERLRSDAGRTVRIWPFEDHAPAPPGEQGDDGAAASGREQRSGAATVVVAEVWPTPFGVIDGPGPRDRQQVTTVAEHLWGLDDRGRLASMLDAAPRQPAVRGEEGWALGAEDPSVLATASGMVETDAGDRVGATPG
jgi:hypothetical protein